MVTAKGKETRATILATAVDIASVEGLEGLTIGRLAHALHLSKSGLFGHFGSKEDLQLATIRTARRIFSKEVVLPAAQAEAGLARLWALCDAWLSYMEGGVFQGGCFFIAAAAEFDGRPGPVRDAIAASMQEWLTYLEEAIHQTQALGEITTSVSASQIAFELHAFYLNANWAMQLLHNRQSANQARIAILSRLHSLVTVADPPLPPVSQYDIARSI